MTVNGWIPVDKRSLKTKYSNVYAIGDVSSVGVPKAGMFAEGAARVAAEFGQGQVGRADVDFFSGQSATGVFFEASETLAAEKENFESSRRVRWFSD